MTKTRKVKTKTRVRSAFRAASALGTAVVIEFPNGAGDEVTIESRNPRVATPSVTRAVLDEAARCEFTPIGHAPGRAHFRITHVPSGVALTYKVTVKREPKRDEEEFEYGRAMDRAVIAQRLRAVRSELWVLARGAMEDMLAHGSCVSNDYVMISLLETRAEETLQILEAPPYSVHAQPDAALLPPEGEDG